MSQFTKIGNVLDRFDPVEDKYISREFQKYGYDLAEELNDLKHTSLYIKLAKDYPRILLERARSFVKDANNAKSKPRLFMWKVHQLKIEMQDRKGVPDPQEERRP